MPNDWLKEIAAEMTLESLPAAYQELAHVVGIDGALRLSSYLGGMAIYYPKLDALIQRLRDDRIRAEFNGSNHRELARKYDLTERWIREIVQQKSSDTQTSLF